MGTWTNNDGLYIKYGPTEVENTKGGYISTMDGPYHQVEFKGIALETLAATATPTILADNIVIPDNAFIWKVQVVVREATAGANANLDLGLVRLDRTTEIDFNGLLAASDGWHTAAVGTTEEFWEGTTEHGALLGTTITNPGLVVAGYETAAFTDGTVDITIWYRHTV
jgi:hypothetical protein